MIKKHIDLISKNILFENFTREDLLEFLDIIGANTVNIEKGQDLFVEGEKFENMCILLEGEMILSKSDENGNRNIIDKVEPGQIFAEVFSMTSSKVCPVTATGGKKSVVVNINTDKLLEPSFDKGEKFNNEQAHITACLINTFADKNMILMNKIEILSRRNTREKILHFLEKEQIKSNSIFFEIPYSRKEMADFLGVDRSALSRELGKLKDDGIIDFEKSTFKFLGK